MKKVLLTMAAVCGLAFASQAQETRVGLKAGVNFASLAGDDNDGFEGRIGYHVGGMASFGITETVAIQPEVLFSVQGAQLEDDADFKFNLAYVNIPIMAKVMLMEGLNLQFGPQIGINVTSEFKDDNSSIDSAEFFEILTGERVETNTIDFSLGVGLGYETPSGFSVGARYNYSLNSVFEEVDGEKAETYNSVIQVSLGYFFN